MDKTARYIEQLLTGEVPIWNVEAALEDKPPRWNYVDGCMALAFLRLYDALGDARLLQAAQRLMDRFVGEDGALAGYSEAEWNLDSINGGKALLWLHALTGEPKYRLAADRLVRQLHGQPRTPEGSFWHKKIYPNQVWLDGLYMALPFYAEAEGAHAAKDVRAQFETVRERMREPDTGLYYHGYDASLSAFWSNPVTGCSRNFWSRSLGWCAMALIDTLEKLPGETIALQAQLLELLAALLPFRDAETGLYFQVPDKASAPGNYAETSGSCAIAYTLLKAARLGYAPPAYARVGEEIFRAVEAQKLIERDGSVSLGGICLVAGLGGMAGKGDYAVRDGSYEYYISEPVVENDAKGAAPFLFCYAELAKGATR